MIRFLITSLLYAIPALALTSCFSHKDLDEARHQADQSNYEYNSKRAEKSITQARYKFFISKNDTNTTQNEERILKSQSDDESKAKKQANEDKEYLETVKKFCCYN